MVTTSIDPRSSFGSDLNKSLWTNEALRTPSSAALARA